MFLMFEVYVALSVGLCQMYDLISFLYGGKSVTNKQCFVYIVTGTEMLQNINKIYLIYLSVVELN